MSYHDELGMAKQVYYEAIFSTCHPVLEITDPRDLAEIERRMKAKTFQPRKEELYTFNKNFDGKYTD